MFPTKEERWAQEAAKKAAEEKVAEAKGAEAKDGPAAKPEEAGADAPGAGDAWDKLGEAKKAPVIQGSLV